MATVGSSRLTLKPHVLIPTLLSLLLLLLVLTNIYQRDNKQPNKIERRGRKLKKVESVGDKFTDIKIDPRLLKVPDSRSLYCKQIVYPLNPSQRGRERSLRSVSIILIFSDYQFYEMKKSLESILLSECMQLVQEILVVDDATALDYIVEQYTTYLRKIPAVRLMKTNSVEPLGMARARNLAAKVAEGTHLVFIDNTAVVSRGWLQPLVHWVTNNKQSIATPHFDLIRDPVSMFYSSLPDNTTFTITLTLSIRPFQVAQTIHKSSSIHTDSSYTDSHHNDHSHNDHSHIDYSHTAVYDSAALRGDVLAVQKSFFLQKLGGYDEALQEFGGGQHVDLSLKAWLCGSGVKVMTCSRVGVVNVLDPVKTRSGYNVKLLVKKWFHDSGFSKTIYRLVRETKISMSAYDDDDGDDKERAKQESLSEQATKTAYCKVPIKRYINKVAANMVRLREDSVAYGVLKAGTNRCAHLIHTESMIKIKMDPCERLILLDPRGPNDFRNKSHSLHERETIFQMTKSGELRVGSNHCVTTQENAYLSVEECRSGDAKQVYHYKDGLLVNTWSKYCVMQVTDPDPRLGSDRQIAMVQTCDSYAKQDKDFMTWTFINL